VALLRVVAVTAYSMRAAGARPGTTPRGCRPIWRRWSTATVPGQVRSRLLEAGRAELILGPMAGAGLGGKPWELEGGPTKDGMDVLQAWLDRYNERAGRQSRSIPVERRGARNCDSSTRRTKDTVSILHLGRGEPWRPTGDPRQSLRGPTAETSVQAGLWASAQLGRRPGAAG